MRLPTSSACLSQGVMAFVLMTITTTEHAFLGVTPRWLSMAFSLAGGISLGIYLAIRRHHLDEDDAREED